VPCDPFLMKKLLKSEVYGSNGRKFGGNSVVAVYYSENKFAQGDYEG